MPVFINGVPTQSAISLANGASIAQIQEALSNLHYRGPHANEAAFPSTGTSGQFLFNEDTTSLWVWDESNSEWSDVGVAEGGAGANIATQLEYLYDSVTGTGYGFADAQPGRWELTPDGRAQCIGGSYGNSSAIRFARLAEPGDTVTIPGMSISLTASSNQRRFLFAGVTAGQDPQFKANQGAWANAAFSQISDDPSAIEFGLCWIGAYFQAYSYGPGMITQGGGSNNKAPADIYDFDLTFTVRSDYRIEASMDGVVFALQQYIPPAGVDLYFVASPTNILPAPTGNVTTGSAPPSGSTTPVYLSTTDPLTGVIVSGNGYYLYEANDAVTEGDVALTAEEASTAEHLRHFHDFNGLSVSEVSALMAPVAAKDRETLDHCQNLAVGWFHAQDLTVPEIQGKMVVFADALAAANAGSIELTLAALQAIPLQGAGNTVNHTFVAHGFTMAGSEGYVYCAAYGQPANNVYGITYVYFRDYPSFDGYGNLLRLQFQTTEQRDDFVNDVSTINVAGYASAPMTVAGQPGTLLVDYHYPDAAVVRDYALLGGSVAMTFAEALPNDDDALVQDCIGVLTTHLSKFPR